MSDGGVYVSGSEFLSTPSGWRATAHGVELFHQCFLISIHALRVEGDRQLESRALRNMHFYPRPPGGGRQDNDAPLSDAIISIHALRVEGDAKTPSKVEDCKISIHALRVEGDRYSVYLFLRHHLFLSTPSGWRATFELRTYCVR